MACIRHGKPPTRHLGTRTTLAESYHFEIRGGTELTGIRPIGAEMGKQTGLTVRQIPHETSPQPGGPCGIHGTQTIQLFVCPRARFGTLLK